jgi:pimeloyl-ACP methyl ester carboxylesterase/class 3 adenylate cyclase
MEGPLPAGALAPAFVGYGQQVLGGALDDRDELDELGAEVVAEEAVDVEGVVLVGGVDRAEEVHVNPVPAEEIPAAHHVIEGAGAALVHAVGVMHLAGAVDAEADKEGVLLEEGTPLVVQAGAVGLDGVANHLAGTAVALDVVHGALEEVEAHEGGLAALPGDDDVGSGVGLQEQLEVCLQEVVGHAEAAAGVEHLLGEEEAVLAVQVADGPGGLDEDVVGGGSVLGSGEHGEGLSEGFRLGFTHRTGVEVGLRTVGGAHCWRSGLVVFLRHGAANPVRSIRRRAGVATCGAGPPLIIIPGWISHVELDWAFPAGREFYQRLAENNLVVRYDKRGTGLSDRNITDYSPEANLRDLEAIITALGKAALMGHWQGGPISIAYEHPENVSHLIIYGSYHDGTTAVFRDLVDGFVALIKADWGGYGATAIMEMFVPGLPPEGRAGVAEFFRQAADADGAIATMKSLFDFRVTELLPHVKTPTLVLHRKGDKTCPFQQGRELAARISGARFVPLEGDIHVIVLGDVEPIVMAIGEFLSGQEGATARKPAAGGLQTIVFTDIVSSTELTQKLGDEGFQGLLRAHNQAVRSGLGMMGGTEIKHTATGLAASFPWRRALSLWAIGMQNAGCPQRSGAHEPDLGQGRINAGEPVRGRRHLEVQMARRICDSAGPGQILASDVVRQLVAGKGIEFRDLGKAELKGFAEAAQLYEIVPPQA